MPLASAGLHPAASAERHVHSRGRPARAGGGGAAPGRELARACPRAARHPRRPRRRARPALPPGAAEPPAVVLTRVWWWWCGRDTLTVKVVMKKLEQARLRAAAMHAPRRACLPARRGTHARTPAPSTAAALRRRRPRPPPPSAALRRPRPPCMRRTAGWQEEGLEADALKPHKAKVKEAVDAMMKKILAERAAEVRGRGRGRGRGSVRVSVSIRVSARVRP
jgi:hypothetical protein